MLGAVWSSVRRKPRSRLCRSSIAASCPCCALSKMDDHKEKDNDNDHKEKDNDQQHDHDNEECQNPLTGGQQPICQTRGGGLPQNFKLGIPYKQQRRGLDANER